MPRHSRSSGSRVRKNTSLRRSPWYGWSKYLGVALVTLGIVGISIRIALAQSVTPYPTPTTSETIYAVTLTPTVTPTSPPATPIPLATVTITNTPTPTPEQVVITTTPAPIATVPFGYTPPVRTTTTSSLSPTSTVLGSQATSSSQLKGEKKLYNRKTASKVTLAGTSQLVLEEEDSKSQVSYRTIATDQQGLIGEDSLVDQYEGVIIWTGEDGKMITAYNLDTDSYTSASIDETGVATLVFYTPNTEKIRVTYNGTTFTYQNLTQLIRDLDLALDY